MRFDPMPAATIPAPNHSRKEASVASTPPVGMILVQGMGPSTAFTNDGPPTLSPGKTFTISQPSSWASLISVAEPQPGEYGMPRRLQSLATSGFVIGPTTKFAPLAM